MTATDIPDVVKLARRAYKETISDLRASRGVAPWADRVSEELAEDRITSTDLAEHLLRTDPDTCFVIEDAGTVRGVVMAAHREGLLITSMIAVAPKSQGRGYSQELLAPLTGIVDAAARSIGVVRVTETMRFLFPANFDVHPSMRAEGVIDRSKIPHVRKVRSGTLADRERMIDVDRRLRGASRGPDHDLFFANSQLFVAEDGINFGYAYCDPNGSPLCVASTATNLARELLVTALASAGPDSVSLVRNLTGEQRWAFDVVRRLGLGLRLGGPIVVRGMALPTPYLAHDALG